MQTLPQMKNPNLSIGTRAWHNPGGETPCLFTDLLKYSNFFTNPVSSEYREKKISEVSIPSI